MKLTHLATAAALMLGAVAFTAHAQEAAPTAFDDASNGAFILDKSHANIIFRIDHLGFSGYFGRFNSFDGTLQVNAKEPAKSQVSITIDPTSIDTNNDHLHEKMAGAEWFNVAKFPQITYKSTAIELTGGNKAKMTGDLTFLGVTKPVTLDVTFNKQGLHPYAGVQTLGFSARGSLKRSDFGMSAFIPNVGDEVELMIDVEFAKVPADQ